MRLFLSSQSFLMHHRSSNIVPSAFKAAEVRLLLKKAGLDPNVFKNYWPVSNLPFLSKIFEKIVLAI